LQWASGALLGSEQLNGGGSYAVRGYGESTAFGDGGIVMNNELHAPAWSAAKGRDRVDVFGFYDLASLNLRVDNESTDLRSVGVGLNYQFGQHFSVHAAYGWQLKRLDRSAEHAHGHLAAQLSF
jgi:hemolysin activation/secretion protein